jgi:rubrerythrin
MSKLDLAKLTLQDALDVAILIEDEAQERYQEFAEQLEKHHTGEAAEFFRVMVEQETKHGNELRQRRKELFADAPSKVSMAMIPRVETADYDATRAFMTPHQALRVGLASEVRAHDFYNEALAHVADTAVKGLFEELRSEELDHQAQIERLLARLGPEDTSNPNDFADEPVAQ